MAKLGNKEYGYKKSDNIQRQSDTDKISKLIITDTLYYQIGLITDGC